MLGNTLFMGTIDAHLVAVDATNGRLVWDTKVGTANEGYAITMAPLVVKDKVIIGTAGGEQGIIGFIAAFDVNDGQGALAFQDRSPGRASRATRPGATIPGSTAPGRCG